MPQWLKEYEQSPVKDKTEFPCVKKKIIQNQNKSTEALLIYIIVL